MSDDEEIHAVGWDAIDAALEPIYHGREHKHYGVYIPMMLGGKDPLQGISAYKNTDPLPHFHFVTYGFSELYEKESDDPEVSGFGFELTFRLACASADEDPPAWALNFLQNLARYVFSTGNPFAKHHHMNLNGPIALDEDTQIGCIAFAADPQLGEVDTENGRVSFLQIVGLCADEYELTKDWDCERMVGQISQQWPLLITDLKRKSILADPDVDAAVRTLAAQEGSSQGELFASKTEWQVTGGTLHITLSATAAIDVRRLLVSRIFHSRPFAVYGREQGIVIESAAETGWKTDETLAVLSISSDAARQMLQSLRPERGKYHSRALPGVILEVVPSEIKDQDGNVIKVIG